MQKKTKLIGNIIFMLLLLGATMYLLLKDQDLPEIRRLLQGASGSMILFAVLCAVMYLILESTSLIVILRSLGERMHFFPSLRYSFIGFLFNALTPSASGGQPMMVLYMKADGINMGASSVAMLFWTIIGDRGSDRGAVLPSVYGKDTGTLSMVVLGWDGSQCCFDRIVWNYCIFQKWGTLYCSVCNVAAS